MKLHNRLVQMLGGTYRHMARDHKITGFRIKESIEKFFIATDKDLLEYDLPDADEILSGFEKVEDGGEDRLPVKSSAAISGAIKDANLTQTLVDSIKNMNNNNELEPEKIKLALMKGKYLNETIKTLLEVAKTEIAINKAGR